MFLYIFDPVNAIVWIQNQLIVVGETPKYNWTLPSLVTIVKEEGIAAAYKVLQHCFNMWFRISIGSYFVFSVNIYFE